MKLHVAALTGLLLLHAAALAAADPAGNWEGTMKMPNGDVGFAFNLHQEGGKWLGEMDIPSQHVSEMPLNEVKVDGAAVSIGLPGPGNPRFDGKLSEDGKTLAGKFSQGDSSFPLELKWKSGPKVVVRAPANSGEVQVLEGVWEGTLNANGTQLHLRFNFTKNSDGSIAGTIDSLDQGANGIPITSIARTADTVKMDVKAVAGAYEGTLDKEAATMTGTWSQGGGTLPLKLERKKAEKKS